MKTRIIAGLCMVPLLLLVWLGGYWLIALCVLIGLIGIRELGNGFRALEIRPSEPIAVGALIALYLINSVRPYDDALLLAWLAACTVASFLYLFQVEKRKVEDGMATLLTIVYVVFFSYHVVRVDQIELYRVLVWLVLLSAFCTDIFAYFTGYFLGKHKLCPNLSPKKTVEGAVGGTLGSVVCCGLFGFLVVPDLWVHCAVIGLIGAAMAQFGDLSASAMKRKMGIKDYGNLIPGHGGILDRFDSVLFTAPTVYYYIILVLQP